MSLRLRNSYGNAGTPRTEMSMEMCLPSRRGRTISDYSF